MHKNGANSNHDLTVKPEASAIVTIDNPAVISVHVSDPSLITLEDIKPIIENIKTEDNKSITSFVLTSSNESQNVIEDFSATRETNLATTYSE